MNVNDIVGTHKRKPRNLRNIRLKGKGLYTPTAQDLQEGARIQHLEDLILWDGSAGAKKAIATLPEKQQLVFNMKYFQDLKYSELSEILETSEGALKASYHIAVKKIEAYLTED